MDRLDQLFAFAKEIDKERKNSLDARRISLMGKGRKMTRSMPGIWR